MSTPARSRARRLPSQRCINCSILLAPNLRRYTVEELNEQMTVLLRTWTMPTPVTPDNILCIECYLLLQERILSNITGSHEDMSPVYGHLNICYGCGISIASRRTHRVELDCTQRSMILRWTLTHLVPHLQRVCIPCWLAATRETRRLEVQDSNRPDSVMDAGSPSLEDTGIPEPPPMPAPTPQTQQVLQVQSKINSQKYKRVAAASRHCIFVGCENNERLLVPMTIKELLLLQYNIYIPLNARICHHHLHSNQWDELTAILNDFTGFQVDDIFSMLERASQRTLDFNNIAAMDSHLRHYWLGLTEMQFNEILNSVPSLNNAVRNPSLALSIFLVKLRTGDSNQRLTTLFQLPRSTLEKKMKIVRECLKEHFVPMHLGLTHTNVQNVASRNRTIPEGLFGDSSMTSDAKPAIVICDGTYYVYVQSSSNYKYQKQTYSLHKYANLVKPFLMTCCDGYILECTGPYEATKNDSTIMSDLFHNESSPMRSFFRQGDVFILDRGFRDVIPELESYNYKTYMPESLLENEFQLTTDQANKSRCVTMCRWVVEVVNGRIKRDYKLFRQEYFNRASPHLMDDFKIACALLNKFHPTIEDRPDAAEYLQIAQARLNTSNFLGEFIRRENINRRRAVFQNIDSNAPHLDHFPRLTLDDLRRFALGSYQLKQARSYYGEHIRSNGTYNVEVSNVLEEDLPLILGQNSYLIRARIKSRHVSHKTYYSYLLISRDENRANSLESIIAYYCNCLVGNRTVGCCAHTMTVLWYLSWGRFNNVSAPAPFLDEIFYEE